MLKYAIKIIKKHIQLYANESVWHYDVWIKIAEKYFCCYIIIEYNIKILEIMTPIRKW